MSKAETLKHRFKRSLRISWVLLIVALPFLFGLAFKFVYPSGEDRSLFSSNIRATMSNLYHEYKVISVPVDLSPNINKSDLLNQDNIPAGIVIFSLLAALVMRTEGVVMRERYFRLRKQAEDQKIVDDFLDE